MKQLHNLGKFAIAILAAFLLNACITDDPDSDRALAVGDALPEFSATLSDGSVLNSADMGNHTLVVVLFNTSCSDCREELPQIQKFYEESGKNSGGIVTVVISREENAAAISEYWEENGLSVPWSAQTDRKIYSMFANTGIPRVYAACRGIIIASWGPENPPTADQLFKAVLFSH